jgi:hypothetical protein
MTLPKEWVVRIRNSTAKSPLPGFSAAHNQRLFDKWLRGTRLVGQVTDLRFLGPDVAVMHAVGGTVRRDQRDDREEHHRDQQRALFMGARRELGVVLRRGDLYPGVHDVGVVV